MAKKSDACFQMPCSPLRRHSEPLAVHGSWSVYVPDRDRGQPLLHAPLPGRDYVAGHDPSIPEPDYETPFPPPPPPMELVRGAGGPRRQSADSKAELHKEFLWNIKNGVNVLQQKPELQRELDRRKEERKRREFEEYKLSKKSTFDLKMERQFKKLEQMEQSQTGGPAEEGGSVTELQRVHNKLRLAAGGQSPDAASSAVPARLKNLF